jgi:hypothetical protein
MSTYKELAGLKIKTVTSDPSNPLLGEMWYNSTAGSIKVRTFAPGSWTAGNPAPGSYMTFAGCGTKAAYIKTMGNDGTPAPNPLGDDSQEYDGTNWTSVNASPYAVQEIQEVLEFKQQQYFLEDKEDQGQALLLFLMMGQIFQAHLV